MLCEFNKCGKVRPACIRAVSQNTALKLSLHCFPEGSYVSLEEYTTQYCPRFEGAGNIAVPGRYPYSAPWYTGGIRPVLRRPASGGTVLVKQPATRKNNEFNITYTATDSSDNTATCSFIASLQVDCKAMPSPSYEAGTNVGQDFPTFAGGGDGGFYTTPANSTIHVPCDQSTSAEKTAVCGTRGTWVDIDLSECPVTARDNAAAFEFSFEWNPDDDRRRSLGESSPDYWSQDECANTLARRVEITDPIRRSILLDAMVRLSFMAKDDLDTSLVYKVCRNEDAGYVSPYPGAMRWGSYEVLLYNSALGVDALCEHMQLLRDAHFGSGNLLAEVQGVDTSTKTLMNRLDILKEAERKLDPLNRFPLVTFPTCVAHRTVCLNTTWDGQAMDLATVDVDTKALIVNINPNVAACLRLRSLIIDNFDHRLDLTRDDLAHDGSMPHNTGGDGLELLPTTLSYSGLASKIDSNDDCPQFFKKEIEEPAPRVVIPTSRTTEDTTIRIAAPKHSVTSAKAKTPKKAKKAKGADTFFREIENDDASASNTNAGADTSNTQQDSSHVNTYVKDLDKRGEESEKG